MKKLLCISLIGFYLVNLVGGYWVFYAIQQQSKTRLAHELDGDHYAGSQAITIKLPLSQPVSGNDNYERVDGEFEFEGTIYRLVKQKFYKDTAYIVCYKDERTLAIKDALEDYVKSFTDKSSEKKSDTRTASLFIKDYLHHGKAIFIVHRIAQDVVSRTIYVNHYQHPDGFAVEYPPEIIG